MMRLGVPIKYSIKRSIADIKYPVMTSHYDRIPLSIFQCQLISYPKRIVIFYQNGIILLPLDPQLISTWPPAALRDLLASILLQEFCWTAGGEAAEVWPPFKESERYHFSTFLEMREFSYIAFDHVLFESMHIGDSQRFAEIPRVENPRDCQRSPKIGRDSQRFPETHRDPQRKGRNPKKMCVYIYTYNYTYIALWGGVSKKCKYVFLGGSPEPPS